MLCRLKADKPATAIPPPIKAKAKPTIEAPGKGSEATEQAVETTHMTTANTTASATGGALSSNACIEQEMQPNQELSCKSAGSHTKLLRYLATVCNGSAAFTKQFITWASANGQMRTLKWATAAYHYASFANCSRFTSLMVHDRQAKNAKYASAK